MKNLIKFLILLFIFLFIFLFSAACSDQRIAESTVKSFYNNRDEGYDVANYPAKEFHFIVRDKSGNVYSVAYNGVGPFDPDKFAQDQPILLLKGNQD